MASKVKLSEYCKQLREKSGLNKTDFANKIGISDVQVGKIEHGQMDSPTFLVLLRIFTAYNMSIDDLNKNVDFSHMGEQNFISSFEYYLNKGSLNSQNNYLIELSTMYFENNGYYVEYPSKNNYNSHVFIADIRDAENNPYCLMATKGKNNVIYGYIINSSTQIKSKLDEIKICQEIDTVLSNIIHPNYLIDKNTQKNKSFMPGLIEKNKFDLYFITGSKTVYDSMIKYKNTFQLIDFNIFCLFSRYKDNWEVERLN